MLKTLSNIYNEHKHLYTVGVLLMVLPIILKFIFPHLSFLMVFLCFCGMCSLVYGLLLHFEKSENNTVSIISKVFRYTALFFIALFLITQVFIQSKIIFSIKTTDEECDYILVLGSGLEKTKLTRTGIARADAAIEYMNKYPNCTAILCGGQGKGELITEAQALYNYMVNKSIDPTRLICETKSTDTTENINYAVELIKQRGSIEDGTKVAVVTNDFHLYRSMLIMKKAGIKNAYSINAPTPKISFMLMHISLHLREYFSVILEYLNI